MQTIVRRALLCAGMAAGAALAACDGAPGAHERPARQARAYEPTRWRRLWSVGGAEGDTTLLDPWRLAVGDSLVFVTDKAAARVAAFRLKDGSLAWMRGRGGSGPGEFREPSQLAAASDGGVWVGDPRNGRITVLGPDGAFRAAIPFSGQLSGMCPLAGGGMLVNEGSDATPLAEYDAAGRLVKRMALPWPDLKAAEPLTAMTAMARGPRGCVVALVLGRGFAVYDGKGWRTHPYVESRPLPEVQEKQPDKNTRVTLLKDARYVASSVGVGNGEISVSSESDDTPNGYLIDVYREADGAYLRSMRTPGFFDALARHGESYVFLTMYDGYPALVALHPETRPRPAR